jgi:hypothetical protein
MPATTGCGCKRKQTWRFYLNSFGAARQGLASTEMSPEVTSLGAQVHGGMGFIEEAGAAYRDAKNLDDLVVLTAIQAIDLVGRKTRCVTACRLPRALPPQNGRD